MTTDGTLSIRVNGEHRRVHVGMSLFELVAELGLEPTKVAVERNEEIVPRSAYPSTVLGPGDQIEVVHFIGGG